jgi:hypothetical protein
MAVKRYNGTSWDTVAGLGAQGAAATSSSITTWVKTASGGETSLTGSSDSSTTLAYTPGQEQFFINGVLQVRGSDYTATNGTSITGIAALTAGDIATVTTVNAFSVTGAVPLSTVTANGDLIVGTSSGAVGRLGIGSTDQVLKVSGGVPTWATPAAPTFVGCAVTKYDQSINSSTWTALTFTVEDFDTDGFHDNSSNTSRITIPSGKGGKYSITANADFTAAGTGGTFRAIRLYKNGALYESPTTGAVVRSIYSNINMCSLQLSWTLSLVATDYLEIYAFQDSGSAVTLNNNLFGVTYLGA